MPRSSSKTGKSSNTGRRGLPISAASLPKSLRTVNLNAAGIDVGATQHYVAVPEGRDEVTVRCFGTFTADLHALADWLER
jgi:transposase